MEVLQMIDNFKATKLGDDENSDYFQTNVPIESNYLDNLSLKGTVIGKESEFEESLKKNQETEKSSTDSTTNSMSEEKMYGMDIKDYSPGEIVQGTIISIEKAGVFVDIQFKCEGFVSNEELNMSSEEKENLSIGEKLRLMLIQLETKEGYSILSKKRADWELAWDDALESKEKKEYVEAEIINAVKGGLVANYNGLRGFIPASLVTRTKDEPLKSFINKKIQTQLIEVDKKRKKIILSNKFSDSVSEKNVDMQKLEELEVGQVIKGKVSSIKNFGAFVNVNGVEGLVHISEISWDRIERVEDVLNVGDEIEVFIIGIDKEEKKVSLGLKQLTADPWESVTELYPIGTITTGTINRLSSYGAFVKLDKGLEGLIHISELSKDHIENVETFVSVGQKVTVKILRIVPEQQKIGLSLRQTNDEDDNTVAETTTEILETTN
jgi:small subunit ribosomal protein S1